MPNVRTEARFRLPRFHKGALGLFLLTVALTAFVSDMPVGEQLRVEPGAIFSGGGLWQPITANFVFPGTDIGLLLGTFFAQWLVGSELEAFWGTRRYVTLVLGCGIAGYLVYALLEPVIPGLMPHGGSNAMDAAALAAFGVVFGKRELDIFGVINMRARTLAWIFLPVMMIGPILRGTPWPVVIPWLVASAGAFLVTLQPWRARGDGTTPKRPKPKGKASHLRVVKGEDLLN